ncbi:MAG: DinB family protein [Algicola sp.]|nr:DinB family protein [Algicola sp.]
MTKNDLSKDEYHPYYQGYIEKSGDAKLNDGLRSNMKFIINFLEAIPEEKQEYRYEPRKWTIKEIVQHLIDTERVFTYRALCMARGDKTLLPGYDQDDYVSTSDANSRTMHDLIDEYRAVRLASSYLFHSLTTDMLAEKGIANNSNLTARAVVFILIGHENHHCQIIEERYL